MRPQQQNLTEHLTPEQSALFEEDLPWLEKFAVKHGTTLLAVEENTEHLERSEQGLMYFFDDALGGYTIKVIKNSLGENVYYL